MKFSWKYKTLIHENASDNIFCEREAILFTGRWINWYVTWTRKIKPLRHSDTTWYHGYWSTLVQYWLIGCQAITWATAHFFVSGHFETNLREILIKKYLLKEHLKMSAVSWHPFFPGLDVFKDLEFESYCYRPWSVWWAYDSRPSPTIYTMCPTQSCTLQAAPGKLTDQAQQYIRCAQHNLVHYRQPQVSWRTKHNNIYDVPNTILYITGSPR